MSKLFDSKGNLTMQGIDVINLILQVTGAARARLLYQVGKEYGQAAQYAMIKAARIIEA